VDLFQTFSLPDWIGWILVPVGLFLGLLGYRFYRISLFLIVLLAGFMFGIWLGSKNGNPMLYQILGLVIGTILGVISYLLIKFSFFVFGMAGGFILGPLGSFIIKQTGLVSGTSGEFILISITAFVCGVLTIMLHRYLRYLIIILTSVIGTYLIRESTIDSFPPNSDIWPWILYVILLLVFIIVQRKSNSVKMAR